MKNPFSWEPLIMCKKCGEGAVSEVDHLDGKYTYKHIYPKSLRLKKICEYNPKEILNKLKS